MSRLSIFLLAVVSLCSLDTIIAQGGKPFKVAQQLYLKGNAIVIGNNTMSDHPTRAFDEVNIMNDEVKMQYIDVDNDNNTFSSSSATIENENEGNKVIYAGLYWSGLYPFETGVIRPSGTKKVHKGKGIRDTIVEQIKIKLPKSKTYIDIEGTVLYDSFRTPFFENNTPYVFHADITHLFPRLNSIAGEYTVANVKASKGMISGGSAAGWLLYLVYEDENETPKFFTTYDGLVEVNKKTVEITFKDFEAKPEGAINSNIVLATLEGDNKIKTDDCAIYHQGKDAYVSLTNELRAPKNFFNSAITHFNEPVLSRNPPSLNTLGFDLLKHQLPQGSIANNAKDATLKFYAKADRFYLFFAAFETEIPENFLAEKKNTITSISENEINEPKIDLNKEGAETETVVATQTSIRKPIVAQVDVKDDKGLQKEKEVIFEQQVIEAEKPIVEIDKKISETKKNNPLISGLETISKRPSIPAQGMIKGYYLVTNVFKSKENAIEWKEQMNTEGHNGRIFKNTDSGFHYVYIESDVDINVMYKRQQILKQVAYLKDIWVARLNFD